jgi:hypothetical protein
MNTASKLNKKKPQSKQTDSHLYLFWLFFNLGIKKLNVVYTICKLRYHKLGLMDLQKRGPASYCFKVNFLPAFNSF